MRNRPWTIAQYAVAAVLLVISLIGVIGTLAFDAAELTFSFAGAIQSFGVFPGLVLSLAVNGTLMGRPRAPAPSRLQQVLLVIEFALIAALVLFHFYTNEAGTTFGLAIITWPLVIVLGVTLAILAFARLTAGAADPASPPPPSPA